MLHKETDDKTLLTLIHSGFALHPTANDKKENWTHQGHMGGWTTGFDKLEKFLAEK